MTARHATTPVLVVAVPLAAVSALLVARSPVLGLGFVLLALLGIGVLRDPSVVTVAVVGAIYLNVPVVLARYHGVPEIAAVILPLALAIPFGVSYFAERKAAVIPRPFVWFACFVLVQALGALTARNQVAASGEVATSVFEGLALYLLVVNVVRSTDLLRTLTFTLVLVGGAMGALSAYQYATRTYSDSYGGFAQVSRTVVTSRSAAGLTEDQRAVLESEGQRRAEGPVGEPNRYAQTLAVLIPIGLMLHRSERSRARRALILGAVGGAAVGIALAYSRGALVGVGATLAIMAAMGYFRLRQIVVAAAVGVLVLFSIPGFASRVLALRDVFKVDAQAQSGEQVDTAIRGRVVENLTAFAVFATHPIVGVGPGEFPSYYPEYAAKMGLRGRTVPREAHNLYLGVASEGGLLGLSALAGMVVTTLRRLRAVGTRATDDPRRADLAMGLFFAVVAYLATGFFLHISYARYLWLLLALAAAAGEPMARARAREPASLH